MDKPTLTNEQIGTLAEMFAMLWNVSMGTKPVTSDQIIKQVKKPIPIE